jgi:cytochrome P450
LTLESGEDYCRRTNADFEHCAFSEGGLISVDHDMRPFDPLDPAILECPHAEYAKLRAREPVHYVESHETYFVTRHDLVAQVVRDTETFSSKVPVFQQSLPLPPETAARVGAILAQGCPRLPVLARSDPPEHTKYRRALTKAFSASAIAEIEPLIRSVTTRLIDSWIDSGRIEFVGDFGVPLPLEVIVTALNLPPDRYADYKRWSDAAIVPIGANPTPESWLRAAQDTNEMFSFFASELAERRAEPRDDLLTQLLNARAGNEGTDGEAQLEFNEVELQNMLVELLVAGNETTTKLLAEVMQQLALNPRWWEAIKRDPSLIPSVVEESLRFASPVRAMQRLATRDTELGGVHIPKESKVAIVYTAANRDDAVFDEPDRFDPSRDNVANHFAFSKGVHLCLGATLTRVESRIALEELSTRLASFSLSETNDFAYDPSFMVSGLIKLDLDIVPA